MNRLWAVLLAIALLAAALLHAGVYEAGRAGGPWSYRLNRITGTLLYCKPEWHDETGTVAIRCVTPDFPSVP